MADFWISLPASWRLQDVQAALNVIITVLSTLGTFVFVRYCWQKGARRVARNQDVPLPSLLSLNTLGEAFDVLFLLKKKLLSLRYLTILSQCIVVICLSSTAILSGPIARYSLRQATTISEQDVPGFLATRQHNGMEYANVEWNLTHTRLDDAGFPHDQLLDYIPDNSINWVYNPSQWNNSWSFTCQDTPQTPIKLHDTGNCTGLRYETPNLDSIFHYSKWDGYWHSWDGFYNTPDNNKDILLFIYGWKGWNYEPACNTNRAMNISLVAVHMHNVPRNNDTSSNSTTSECNFRAGPIGKSSYTKITCEIRRKEHIREPCNVAFPDVYTNGNVPPAYTSFYQARFTQQSTSDSPISVITPTELTRFYQVYTIVKDIQYPQPVTRRLSVNLRVVQLSSVFLTIALLIALLIVLGLAQYAWFAVRNRHIMATTPQSKLDWMIQSIQIEDRPLQDSKGRLRRSVTAESSHNGTESGMSRKRTEFEAAKFGGRGTTTWFWRNANETLSTEYGGSPTTDDGKSEGTHGLGQPELVQGQGKSYNYKTPMLNVSASNVEGYGYCPRPL